MVQIATPSRERVEQYQALRVDVEREVGRINGDYGRVGVPAVHYLHQSYSRSELVALFCAADVMMVTPLRDGMNLVAKEYVAARVDLGGVLVLSEFAGAGGATAGENRAAPGPRGGGVRSRAGRPGCGVAAARRGLSGGCARQRVRR